MKPHKVYFACPWKKKRLKRCKKFWNVECEYDNVAGVDCMPHLGMFTDCLIE